LNLSYWEEKYYFEDNDLVVVGAGIVGLSTAIAAKSIRPDMKVLVLERSALPSGASTKNAGFACFGSVTELLSDSNNMTYDEQLALIRMRWEGMGANILYGMEVTSVSSGEVVLHDRIVKAKRIAVCTNGLSRSILPEIAVQAVRNQVYVTQPLANNPLQSCYHFDQGYVYFREIDSRILIGGARNLHADQETTDQFGQTDNLKIYLKQFVEERITGYPINFEYEWSGILGVGETKTPIIEEVANGLFVGVRLGGMGVAIGSGVGKALAEMIIATNK